MWPPELCAQVRILLGAPKSEHAIERITTSVQPCDLRILRKIISLRPELAPRGCPLGQYRAGPDMQGTLPAGLCDHAPSTASYDAVLLMSCPSLREHEDAPWWGALGGVGRRPAGRGVRRDQAHAPAVAAASGACA